MRTTNSVAMGLGVVAWLVAGAAFAGPAPSAAPATSASAAPQAGDAGARKESAEQKAFRKKYVRETRKHQKELTAHHVWSPEMTKLSSDHWRRAYATLRIRELAEDDKDAAAVARADALLKKLDDAYFTALPELVAKAPNVPAAPTLTSPAPGATVAVGTALTFKMAPYKDAVRYSCSLQQSGHAWSSRKGKEWGKESDCTIAADDPRWAHFHAGKAHFTGRAILTAKSAKGKDYAQWSEPVKIDVMLTGGGATPAVSAAPAASTGGAK
jgi:hypothetical protein